MQMKLFTALLLILLTGSAFSQAPPQLSESAEISLITVAPGDELYSGFGHSALLVEDRALSVVFNYGMFNFATPGFYMKFVRGKLDYYVAAERISYLLNSAKHQNRSVVQQKLNLSLTEKQTIYEALLENIKPENRFYKYDFFYDNCTTRIRDLLEDALGEMLVWNRDAEGRTFREYLDIYLADKPWQDFGIDLVLGAPTDKVANKREEMFLPDLLMYHVDEATNDGQDLVEDTVILFEAVEEEEASGFTILPKHVTWFLCLLGIFLSIRHHQAGYNDRLFNRILLFVTGLVGCLIFFLWFLSDHIATVNNWNILWAFPPNVLLVFFLFKKPAKKWHTIYYAAFGIVCFMIVGFYYALPQNLHAAAFPIVLYFTFKSFNLLYRTKKLN